MRLLELRSIKNASWSGVSQQADIVDIWKKYLRMTHVSNIAKRKGQPHTGTNYLATRKEN